ncbi:chromosome segregation protein [Novipirellula aureliae]|uniref:Chromosome segregation protein n=1 Tax=Novipirellula aureliae TaxID=2527966 RepID=A0A5C6E765_9BACT|nr:hypothetical protein [Novipirellula aureliae]TWU43501.1 chromosome segregation protein [Novipirellula aureliae]
MNQVRFLSVYSILLTMLVIGLAFTIYSAYGRLQHCAATVGNLQTQVHEATTAQEKQLEEANRLKQMLGFSEATDLTTIEKAVADDLRGYGTELPDENQDYRSLVRLTTSSIRRLNQHLSEAYEQNRDLREKFTRMEANSQKRLEIVQQSVDKLANDLAEQRENFQADRERLKQMAEQVADRLEHERREKYQLAASYSEDLRKAQQQLDRQQRINKQLAEQAIPSSDQPIKPDGFIAWTDPRSETVWINVGSEDNLKAHTRFSVYEARGETITVKQPKGSIQVIRVVGPHMAEAMVQDSKRTDPLLPGDAIFSPAWDVGQTLGIVIVGEIDIDDDGVDDNDRFAKIVEQNGGRIDSELTADTGYVVVGDLPQAEETSSSRDQDWISAKQTIEDAKMLGVERIGVREFLNHIGWKPPAIERL